MVKPNRQAPGSIKKASSGSRDRIVQAAIDVFAEKGLHGARMDEIGVRAKVNKAMVYYYFSSRQNLYEEVLVTILGEVFGAIGKTLDRAAESRLDPVEKLRAVVGAHFDAFARNPRYARILVEAIASDPDVPRRAFGRIIMKAGILSPVRLLGILDEGRRQGVFRDIEPAQTLVSIIGLNLVHFVAAPIAQAVLNLGVEESRAFQAERKKSILDLLLHGVVKPEAGTGKSHPGPGPQRLKRITIE